MTNVNSNNGSETKSDIFCGTYSNLTSIFVDHRILASFNFIEKVNTHKQRGIKINGTCANKKASFNIYKLVQCLNDF